jgi:hypothetical protein
LTLLVTPVSYSLWEDAKRWTARLTGRASPTADSPGPSNLEAAAPPAP